jgi:hypothetical protein
MPLVVKDRVQETTTTTGTGTITLAGAVSGFQSFSAIGNGNTTYYAIVLGSEWEVGLGTYTLSGTTLSRTTVLESSNSGSLVNFSAGTKNVFVTYPAEEAVYQDETGTAYAPQFAASNGLFINAKTVSTNYTIPTDYNASSAGPVTLGSGISVTVPSGSRWVVL